MNGPSEVAPQRNAFAVVIPTLNEVDTLDDLTEWIMQAYPESSVIIVDDGSTDGTLLLMDRLQERWGSRCHTLRRTRRLGVGRAHKDGLQWAFEGGHTQVVTMDADGSHDPTYLAACLDALSSGDLVVMSRFEIGGGLEGWSCWRKVLTHGVHLLTRQLLGIGFDNSSGMRAYSPPAFDSGAIQATQSDSYDFFFESLYHFQRRGVRVVQVPIVLPARTYGRSKLNVGQTLISLRSLLRVVGLRIRGTP